MYRLRQSHAATSQFVFVSAKHIANGHHGLPAHILDTIEKRPSLVGHFLTVLDVEKVESHGALRWEGSGESAVEFSVTDAWEEPLSVMVERLPGRRLTP